jgi:hypothetical protein
MDPGADLLALLGVLETLKKQHRAGLSPTFGQVEDLFQYADQVRGGSPIPGWGATAPDVERDQRDVLEALRAAPDQAVARELEMQALARRLQEENAALRARLHGVSDQLALVVRNCSSAPDVPAQGFCARPDTISLGRL